MLLVNQLTGFGAGGGALTSLALQGSATLSTAASITAPSDINAGDLLILVDRDNGDSAVSVIPSGFTAILEASGSPISRLNVSAKIANGSEESTSISGMSGSPSKIMACLRGNVPLTAFMVGGVLSEKTTGNPSGLSILAGAATPPLLVIGVYSADAAVDPRTFSTTKDDEAASADTTLYLAWKFYASSPANSIIDMDDEGNGNFIMGAYLTLGI